jgi:hypothetical protein
MHFKRVFQHNLVARGSPVLVCFTCRLELSMALLEAALEEGIADAGTASPGLTMTTTLPQSLYCQQQSISRCGRGCQLALCWAVCFRIVG